MKVSWNKNNFHKNQIRIILFCIIDGLSNDKETNKKRLIVLSHFLASNSVPAFFSNEILSIFNMPNQVDYVIAFDIFNIIDTLTIPLFFHSDIYDWNIRSTFSSEILSIFQRSINLFEYYRLIRFHPIYFFNFLLFKSSINSCNILEYQCVPVKINDFITFRPVVCGNLPLILEQNSPCSVGSYILWPPFNHPFRILSSSSDSMVLLSSNFTTSVINYSKSFYIYISNPPSYYHHLFSQAINYPSEYFLQNQNQHSTHGLKIMNNDILNYNSDHPKNRLSSNFEHISNEFFHISSQTIHLFLETKINVANEDSDDVFFEPSHGYEKTFEYVFLDFSVDNNIRNSIVSMFSSGFNFSCKFNYLSLYHSNLSSFLAFEPTFDYSIPKDSHFLTTTFSFHSLFQNCYSSVEFLPLNIPNILVNCQGFLKEIEPSSITNWLNDRYMPISGPKNAHFVVIINDTLETSSVITFFKSFCSLYQMHGFGSLKKYRYTRPYQITDNKNLSKKIQEIVSLDKIEEFRSFPLIIFLFGFPFMDKSLYPHRYFYHIFEESLNYSEDEISNLAFVLYSKIRIYQPPQTQEFCAELFYNFRYQPAFIITRKNPNKLVLHIAIDIISGKSVWIDDIGSIFHITNNTGLSDINEMLNSIDKFFSNENTILNISFLAEGLSKSVFDECNYAFPRFQSRVFIFTIFPCSQVQISDPSSIDGIVFAPAEQSDPNSKDFIDSNETAFVVSSNFPSYMIRNYSNLSHDDFVDYIQSLYDLSWCSLKLISHQRATSYPPHISMLMQEIEFPLPLVNGFNIFSPT